MKKDKINAIIYGDIVYIEFNEELHVFIPIVGTHGLFMFVIKSIISMQFTKLAHSSCFLNFKFFFIPRTQ